MSAPTRISRREFLETTGAAGAGLVIGFHLPPGGRFAAAPAARFAPNAWLRISPDNSVLIVVDRSEMGQGVTTALPMLVAEELDADWTNIKIEFAPADKAYANPMFGMQGTGGSTSVRAAYTPLRKAGAAAREMLVAAACQTWAVDRVDCRTERGAVIHTGSKRRL
ncbi:MAG TPA: molybdopterin cofactor-binding domain-containing protein, partial [Gemmatimonadales bacterium]